MAKGSFDGPDAPPRSTPTTSSSPPTTTASSSSPGATARRSASPTWPRPRGRREHSPAAWADRKPAVIINIQRQPGANVIETADRVRALLPQLEAATCPPRWTCASDRPHHVIRASVPTCSSSWCWPWRWWWGDLPVPAQLHGHDDPGVAVPLSLVGTFGDVRRRLQPQQPHPDGPHHRHRLRGGRRHRDDREHRRHVEEGETPWRRRSRGARRSASRSSRSPCR
jgi:multidrug efflux pump